MAPTRQSIGAEQGEIRQGMCDWVDFFFDRGCAGVDFVIVL